MFCVGLVFFLILLHAITQISMEYLPIQRLNLNSTTTVTSGSTIVTRKGCAYCISETHLPAVGMPWPLY